MMSWIEISGIISCMKIEGVERVPSLARTNKTVSSIISVKSRTSAQSLRSSKNGVTTKNTHSDVRDGFHPRGLPRATWSQLASPPTVSLFLSRPLWPHCSPVAPGCIEPLGTRITRVLRRRTRRETI